MLVPNHIAFTNCMSKVTPSTLQHASRSASFDVCQPVQTFACHLAVHTAVELPFHRRSLIILG